MGLSIKQAQNKGNITLTEQYGIFLADLTAGTSNYGIYQSGAAVVNVFKGDVHLDNEAALTTGKKLYFDGNGGTSFLYERADNIMSMYISGSRPMDWDASYVAIPATNSLYFDGGVNTRIYEESDDDLHVVVGGVAYLEIDQDIDSLRLGTTASGPNGRWQVAIGGDHTSDGGGTNAAVTMFDGTITGAAGDTEFLAGLRIEPNVTTQTTDQNIGYAATVVIAEPNITEQLGGSSTIGVAATLYIQGAPTEGDVDAAIYVAAGAVHIDSTPADTVVSGVTASFTAGEALEDGEVVYLKASDSKVWKAVATAAATSRAMGMVVKDAAADATVQVLLQGFLRADTNFPTWTIGGAIYTPEAETSSKNVPEQAAPDTDGDFVQVLGWASDANTVYFNPSNDIIEHA
jgi:hypothetical protein